MTTYCHTCGQWTVVDLATYWCSPCRDGWYELKGASEEDRP